MIEDPQIVQTEAQHTAALHLTIPSSEMRTVMGPSIEEVVAAIKAQGLEITGPWFTHHLIRPIETFDFEICFPVASPITPAGRVQPSQWPAMKVARTVYHGPYDGLPGAWGEFQSWITSQHLSEGTDFWERYLINPHTSPDPATWRTELNRPLAS